MIEVSFQPTGALPVGRLVPVVLRIHNVSDERCTAVCLELRTTPTVSVPRGELSVRLQRLEAGAHHDHPVVLLVASDGRHECPLANFSYRDQRGRPVRHRGTTVAVDAETPDTSQPAERKAPRLRGSLFVSYRRSDSDDFVSRLAPRLEEAFPGRVFHDRPELVAGDEWRARLDRETSSCTAMVVVIGRGWLTASTDTGRRRLDVPHDVVRREVAAGLRHRATVVPVLLDDTPRPPREELPDDVAGLDDRQAARVSSDLTDGLDALVVALRRVLG